MSIDHRKAAKNLREAVLDDSNLSASDLRKRLTDEGVDVDRFLKRADEAFRRGLQEGVRQQAAQERARRAVLKGSMFGQLAGKSRDALLALYEAATAGNYGAETMARCRNKDTQAMSDEELRSWLEDIERLDRGK